VGRARNGLWLTAAVLGGVAAGFASERLLVHRQIAPTSPGPPLGSLAGELTYVDGPDGIRVAVEAYGPADAPQLVLAHGWVCTGRIWHEQVVSLAERYRVITYDQPGHGRTSSPGTGNYDLDLLGDTFRAVVEATTASPLVLAGHSLGGMALLNASHRFPDLFAERVTGVVLMSTTARAKAERLTLELGIQRAAQLDRAVRRIVPRLRDPRLVDLTDRATIATSDLSHLVVRAVSTGSAAAPEVVDFTQQLALNSGADVVLGLLEAVIGVDERDGLDQLVDARIPVTIVVGAQDHLTPVSLSRAMATHTGAELLVLARVGHMAPLEAPDQVNEVLLRHLEGRARTRSGRELRSGEAVA
jgi:pimeloyl-ACP methyl ester carboxylesterase